MNFDRLAPYYRWMEKILAGSKLQHCRTAFLHQIPSPERALVLGQGTGEFLVPLLQAHRRTKVTCVDSSKEMLARAQRHLQTAGFDPGQHQFYHADVRAWTPDKTFDLIVTQFFLDCFQEDSLRCIVRTAALAATEPACWLHADFREPPAGWQRWRAALILACLYQFFRWTTALEGTRLVAPDPLLREHGFCLASRRLAEWGLLQSDLWVRPQANSLLDRTD